MAENKQKFSSEVIDLPSGGKTYSKDSSLSSGKIELKYMTTKEEDILTSQNLIKQGIVIDRLLDSVILTPDVKTDDLLIGDKNGILIATRILAYGPEYQVEITNPNTGENEQHTFNLTDCPYKELPEDVDYSTNSFEFVLPVSKVKLTFKLLTGFEERMIEKELKTLKKKLGKHSEISTRLKHMILSIDGDDKRVTVNSFVDNMLSRDSLAFRHEVQRLTPDVIMEQDIEMEGELVSIDIPMDIEFFWPKTI